MTETIARKLNTISEAVRDIMCESHNESTDIILKQVEERQELIDRLLENGEPILMTSYGDRLYMLYKYRQALYLKRNELEWVKRRLHEIRFM